MSPRLSPLETLALEAFARGARALLGSRARSIVLFGSRARGAGRDDSDLDILVLVEAMSREERRAVQDIGADVGLAHGLVLSPLVADADRWRRDMPIARDIEREGVAL